MTTSKVRSMEKRLTRAILYGTVGGIEAKRSLADDIKKNRYEGEELDDE